MKQRFCSYKQHFVPEDQAKLRPRPPGAPPTYICLRCAANRRLPRSEIDRMTREEKEARRQTSSAISKEALDKRKEEA